MNDEAVVYLEADDEVTSVVRRVRAAAAPRTILVAPGRSRAVSSVVALRLLGRAAADAGTALAVVGDALTRSLAAEAGVDGYGTLDDARASRWDPDAPPPPRAAISVVRGPSTAEAPPAPAGAPLVAAGAPPPGPPATAHAPAASPDDATIAVTVPPPRRAARTRSRVAQARRTPGGDSRATIVALLLVVAGGVVGGAALLPGATITIRPATITIGPETYTLHADAERRSGTVEATATVTATGTYTELEPASGTVVLFNWTFFPVRVPAGTFVAAGEQAFATQAEVVVPRGTLTADGRIAAGDIAVAVLAAARGPAANVPAGAIDTIVNESIDAELRGFPENPERRVTNPEATAGGTDATGPQVVQADVDAALAALREDLAAAVAGAVPAGELVVPVEGTEPVVHGVEGLVGARDTPAAEISGEQAWEAFVVDRAMVEEEALARFLADDSLVPDGHELLDDLTVEITGAHATDDGVEAEVEVLASAAPTVDRASVLAAVRGRTAEAAEATLASLGQVDVSLWPGWTATVPSLDWRIDVRVERAEPDAVDSEAPSPRATSTGGSSATPSTETSP